MIKEISKLKLALTSSCTLRCTHCHIDKDISQNLSLNKSIKAINFFLSTDGLYKRLEIYGGEPFIEFKKIKLICKEAKKIAFNNKKNLTIHIATNATIINEKIISWIKENNINIAVSFSGSKESHNFNRVFKDGRGSWEVVLRNIKRLIKEIGNEKIVILYCVDPGFIKNMIKDFNYITSLGIKIIDIECVHGKHWTKKDYAFFQKNIREINQIILQYAYKKNKFIFHEAFINYIINKNNNISCPFYSDLEIYPDGKIGIMPYAFTEYKKTKNKIKVGEIKNKVKIYKKYLKCRPSNKCIKCIDNYYGKFSYLKEGSIAYHTIRENEIKKFFKEIIKKSIKNNRLKSYLRELVILANKFYNI